MLTFHKRIITIFSQTLKKISVWLICSTLPLSEPGSDMVMLSKLIQQDYSEILIAGI